MGMEVEGRLGNKMFWLSGLLIQARRLGVSNRNLFSKAYVPISVLPFKFFPAISKSRRVDLQALFPMVEKLPIIADIKCNYSSTKWTLEEHISKNKPLFETNKVWKRFDH